MNDSELRNKIYTSPDEGYRQLFETYNGYVFAIVYRILGGSISMKDAENCVIDVFSDVIMHFDAASEGSVRAFIGTVARNKAVNLKRSYDPQNKYHDDYETLDISDNSINIEEAAEKSQLLGMVLEQIDALGEPDSTIVIHKYLYERSSSEIAEAVGMKPTAVRVRLSRALKKLRKSLDELDVTI